MDELSFKKATTWAIIIALSILSFFLLKPLLLSIIIGVILVFIFAPIYDKIHKYVPSKNISSFFVCIIIILAIVIPVWILLPVLLEQSVRIYVASQSFDITAPFEKFLPSLSSISDEVSEQISTATQSFITKATNSLMNSISQIIIDLPTLALQFMVVIFTFFFLMRDKEQFLKYLTSLLPFSKETEKKLFEYSRDITLSVIYGQIIIGIIQGVIAGVGFFLFSVPNAIFLTLIAIFVGILPVVGPFLVWGPVAVYLFVAGSTVSAVGVVIFGGFSSVIDNFLRPIIVSKKVNMHPSLVFIGMIGGLFLFGVIGLILGPLILGYLFIILEVYLSNKVPAIFLQKPKDK